MSGGLPLPEVAGQAGVRLGQAGTRLGQAGTRLDQAGARLVGLVRRASELAEAAPAGSVDRWLPVAAPLRPLLPGGALRRGSTVAVDSPASSLVLALLAPVTADGGWAAVVGMPGLSPLATDQAGAALERLAWVPHPGPEWTSVLAALLDGFDLVVVAPPGPVDRRVADRLAARARQRGAVLVPYGPWEGADLTLTAGPGEWEGLGAGRGRLRCRELTVTARGRGAAARPRQVRVRLPDPTGRLAAAPEPTRPAVAPAVGDSVVAPAAGDPAVASTGRQGAPVVARPTLRVVKGQAS